MKHTFYKLSVLILIAVFSLVSAVSASGYAWCFGDDGHVGITPLPADDCCDSLIEGRWAAVWTDVPSLQSVDDNNCSSCLDFSSQKNDAVFFKRLKRVSQHSVKPVPVSLDSKTYHPFTPVVDGGLLTRPLPRISQTILVHRTIVLLS